MRDRTLGPVPLMAAIAVLLAACGTAGSPSPPASPTATASPIIGGVAGAYVCLPPQASEGIVFDFRPDGSLLITYSDGTTESGTWSVEGDAGTFAVMGDQGTFTVAEGRLTLPDGTVCTPAGEASIAGRYQCGPAGATSDLDIVELRPDGTLTITHPDGLVEAGTWSGDSSGGVFGGEGGESFIVEDGRLLFADGYVCTPTD